MQVGMVSHSLALEWCVLNGSVPPPNHLERGYVPSIMRRGEESSGHWDDKVLLHPSSTPKILST